jgi:hypothetical protein
MLADPRVDARQADPDQQLGGAQEVPAISMLRAAFSGSAYSR